MVFDYGDINFPRSTAGAFLNSLTYNKEGRGSGNLGKNGSVLFCLVGSLKLKITLKNSRNLGAIECYPLVERNVVAVSCFVTLGNGAVAEKVSVYCSIVFCLEASVKRCTVFFVKFNGADRSRLFKDCLVGAVAGDSVAALIHLAGVNILPAFQDPGIAGCRSACRDRLGVGGRRKDSCVVGVVFFLIKRTVVVEPLDLIIDVGLLIGCGVGGVALTFSRNVGVPTCERISEGIVRFLARFGNVYGVIITILCCRKNGAVVVLERYGVFFIGCRILSIQLGVAGNGGNRVAVLVSPTGERVGTGHVLVFDRIYVRCNNR